MSKLRRARREVEESEEDKARRFYKERRDQDGFEVRTLTGKGRAVFAKRFFEKGEFLLIYGGELITEEEAKDREEKDGNDTPIFRFFFKFGNKCLCYDATNETNEGLILGRLVNHGNKSEVNSKMKMIVVDNSHPLLCLFATKNIGPGKEILYDYGQKSYPWENKESYQPDKHRHSNNDDDKVFWNESKESEGCVTNPGKEIIYAEVEKEKRELLPYSKVQLFRGNKIVGIGHTMEGHDIVHGRQIKTGWKVVCVLKLLCKNLICWDEFPTHSGEIEEGSFSAWPVANMKDGEQEELYVPQEEAANSTRKEDEENGTNDDDDKELSSEDEYKPSSCEESEDTDEEEADNAHRKKLKIYCTETATTSSGKTRPRKGNKYMDAVNEEAGTKEDTARKRKTMSDADTEEMLSEDASKKSEDANEEKANCIHRKKLKINSTEDWSQKENRGKIKRSEVSGGETVTRSKVYVIQTAEGKRTYDKKHSCFFCKKEFHKIARHLIQVHKDETEVKEALRYSPKDEKRMELFERICRYGNYNHNMQVLELKEGELKVVRRPSPGSKVTPEDYGPCKYCYGFFLREELWRHGVRCPYKADSETPAAREMKYSAKQMLSGGTFDAGCSKFLSEKVLSKMVNDDISLIVHEDKTILTMGSQMLEKKGTEKAGEVSQKMRLLGRVVREGRKAPGKSNYNLVDFLKPQEFDTLLQCARTLAGYEENDGSSSKQSFRSPATAVHCGYELKRAAQILRCQALREKNLAVKEDADLFLQLYEAEWHSRVAAPALNFLAFKKHNTPQLLPLTSDLLELRKFLTTQLARLTKKVNKEVSKKDWRELAELCLARLIMFNKRRGGEAAKITVGTFQSKPNWNNQHNQEIFESLSPSEQQLCKRLDMVEIIGKRNRKVPVILTDDVKHAMTTLVGTRENAEVHRDNDYVFAVNDRKSRNPIRGHDALKIVCKKVKLERPDLINSTNLRKYVATVSQLVDMNESEMGWLANHLGHDIHIHKEYYRLPQSTIEMAVVGNLLMAVDEGRANKFKGKDPRELTLEDFKDQHENQVDEDNRLKRSSPEELLEESVTERISSSEGNCGRDSKRKKKPWKTCEKQAVLEFFKDNIKENKIPKKEKCVKFLQLHDEFKDRTWTNIKDFVRNYLNKTVHS